jgi:hypothetical protein
MSITRLAVKGTIVATAVAGSLALALPANASTAHSASHTTHARAAVPAVWLPVRPFEDRHLCELFGMGGVLNHYWHEFSCQLNGSQWVLWVDK